MKKGIWTLLAFAAMIWAVYEQTKPAPNYYLQFVLIAFFGIYLMRLMNRTRSNFENNNEDTNNEE